MKVAIVTHNIYIGDGQGRVNYELVRYLLRQGVEVHLFADKVGPELVAEGAVWTRVDPGPYADEIDLLKVIRFKRAADRLLRRIGHEYDVIVGCGAVLSHAHTLNAAHFVHGTWLRSPFHASRVRRNLNGVYQWLFSTLNARWELQTFRRAKQVVAVSEMVRRELVDIGVPEGKVEVVVNGVDLQEFAPGPVDRAALGLPEGVVLGLFVGDIQSPIKNLDVVLKGLARVPGVHLAVAGRLGTSAYPALAEKLGIADRVHFLDFRKDIAALMKAADFFTLASRRDSCPLVLLEAMSSGLPIVTSQMVGTANLVGPECGFVLHTPDDLETMVHALQVLATDPARRAAMGRAARAVAEAHSWEKMAEHYLRLIEQHAGARKAPAPTHLAVEAA